MGREGVSARGKPSPERYTPGDLFKGGIFGLGGGQLLGI